MSPLKALRWFVLLALILSANVACSADIKDFEARQYKDADGNVLLYRLYKPKNYDAGQKYPFILFLHGAGERGNNNTAQVRDALHWAKDSVQKDNPCFIMAPQCPGKRDAFQLYGTRKEFDQSFADYGKSAGEWKTYSIPLAKQPAGLKHFLAIVNAADKNASAASEFRNVSLHESGVAVDTPLDLRKLDFSRRQGNGKVTISPDGSTVTLVGDVRVKAPLDYTVTPNTVLQFDFRSTAQGLAHAISMDAEEFFDYRWANVDWSAKKGAAAKDPSTPMRLTLEAMAQLRKEFNLDDQRLYITGLSMGGYGTWDAIARNPKLFAAAVPVCGGADEATAPIIKDIPIWCFHGGADPVVPTDRSRNMIKALKEAGGDPKYTEYPGVGHNSWDKAYSEPDLPKWLFEQKRGEKVR
jgi:poly(3-hydroxybutyrate) depolymerase